MCHYELLYPDKLFMMDAEMMTSAAIKDASLDDVLEWLVKEDGDVDGK